MNFKNKIYSVLKISRPVNLSITAISIYVAGFLASDNFVNDLSSISFAALAGIIITAAGNIINDMYDLEIDKINRPDRILPAGLLTTSEAKIVFFILIAVAFIIGSLINLCCFLIIIFSAIIIFLYSYKLKRILFLGNFTVAFMTGLAFIFGGAVVNNASNGIIPAFFAFFINFTREIVKDIEDIEGDSYGKFYTLPMVIGIERSLKFINLLIITLMILTTLPFILKVYSIEYFLIIMIIVNPVFVYFLKISYNNKGKKKIIFSKLSYLLKLNMVFGLTAILFGK